MGCSASGRLLAITRNALLGWLVGWLVGWGGLVVWLFGCVVANLSPVFG